MATSFEPQTFATLIDRGALQIGDGHRAKLSELGGQGPIFLRAGLVSDDGLQLDGADRFHQPVAVPPAKFALERDTFVTTKGNSIGRPGYIPSGQPPLVYSPHLSYWRSLDRSTVYPEFLRYWARSPDFLWQLRAMAYGTDMAPYLSLVDQKRLLIRLPSIEEQKSIADVLGVLDNKIDSNRRLASLLEETAATLFRARFVDFVGVEEFKESEIGPIPQGWRIASINEFVTHKRDHPANTSEQPYIGLDDMPRGSTVLENWKEADAPTGQSFAFRVGDVLYGKLRPYFRKVGVAPINGRCSTEIVVLSPLSLDVFDFVVGHLASRRFIDHCIAVSSGTRMPRAEWKMAGKYRVAVPPIDRFAVGNSVARPAYMLIRGLIRESRTLAAIRDALLPKLISGEIRVPDTSDPEEVIGPAAAELASAAS